MRDLRSQPFYDVIKEFDNWVVLFRGRQVTIGSMIIMAKDVSKQSLGDISPEAWGEFGQVSSEVEGWIKTTFGAERFNYLALMMKDPEVHFHVIPRYSKPVDFNGKRYEDTDWPLATQLKALELSDEELKAIETKIIEAAS